MMRMSISVVWRSGSLGAMRSPKALRSSRRSATGSSEPARASSPRYGCGRGILVQRFQNASLWWPCTTLNDPRFAQHDPKISACCFKSESPAVRLSLALCRGGAVIRDTKAGKLPWLEIWGRRRSGQTVFRGDSVDFCQIFFDTSCRVAAPER